MESQLLGKNIIIQVSKKINVLIAIMIYVIQMLKLFYALLLFYVTENLQAERTKK